MNPLQLISLILCLAAVMAYLNVRVLKLPSTIGLMALSLLLSLAVLLAGSSSSFGAWLRDAIKGIDFSAFLLDFMLGFLLFAGALHTDINRLRKARWPIITYATIGVLLSTAIIGLAMYLLLPVIYQPVPLLHCLLFGALISPTDPIAVLSILQKAGVSEPIETQITGESLFNDGVGVVVFLTLFAITQQGLDEVSAASVSILLLKEIVGGLVLGWLLGYIGFIMMRRIDHYQTEVLITLALVAGGSVVAPLFHFSGALAMVVAGLVIGNKGSQEAMSGKTQDYVYKFWELIDEILNAVLFVLIGLELILIPLDRSYFIAGSIAIFLVLAARLVSIWIPYSIFRFNYSSPKTTMLLMTWGGLRGGISIALALSLTGPMNRDLFVTITYTIVLFSILVQGLTLERVVRRMKL